MVFLAVKAVSDLSVAPYKTARHEACIASEKRRQGIAFTVVFIFNDPASSRLLEVFFRLESWLAVVSLFAVFAQEVLLTEMLRKLGDR